MEFDFKEFDIEDFIWKAISTGDLARRGLSTQSGIAFRQLSLPGSGIMDIVFAGIGKVITRNGAFKKVYIDVVELKRDIVTCAHVGQLMRYVDCIMYNDADIKRQLGLPNDYIIDVRATLIGAGIDRDAFHLVKAIGNPWTRMIKFQFSFENGIEFTEITHENPNVDVDLSAIPNVKFSRIARASGRICLDLRPKENPSSDGSQSSDLDFLLPNPQSHE